MDDTNFVNEYVFLKPGIIFWREKLIDGWKTQFIDQISLRSGTVEDIGLEIFKLLNGKHTASEIVEKVANEHSSAVIPKEYIENQVMQFLKTLHKWHFILTGNLREQYYDYMKPLFEYNKKHFGFEYRPGLCYWEVTNACNYQCIMCYNYSKKPRAEELTLEEGFYAIDQMKQAGTTGIIFTGGEPTVQSEKLIAWIRYAHENDIFGELFTNGSLISPDMAKRLKESGLKYVRVTIHGAKAETHEKTSLTKGSFNRAVKGLKHLIDAGLPVCWQFTTSKVNLMECREILERAIEMGCHGFRAGSLDYIGKGKKQKEFMLNPLEELVLWKFLAESIIVYAEKIKIGWGADYCKDDAWGYYVRRPQKPNDINAADPNVYFKYAKNSLCGVGIRSLAMTARGDITPCPALPELTMGNIRDGKYQEIWKNGEAFRVLRENLLEDFDGCDTCGSRYTCAGGCRALSFNRHGNLISKDERRCAAVNRRAIDAMKKIHSFYAKDEILEGLSKVELVDHDGNPDFHSVLREGLGPWVPNNEVALYKLNEDIIRQYY